MTDKVTSLFVPQTLLDATDPRIAQDAANQAVKSFFWNALSGDLGRAYNQAQTQGYGVISNAQQLAQQQAALLKAQRDLEAQRNQLLAIKDYSRTVYGEGTSDYSDPRAQFGRGGMGPGYIPYDNPRNEIDVEGLLADPRYLAANPNDTATLKTLTDMRRQREQRETYDALSRQYLRPDGTVDMVRMSQDPRYVQLLENDPGKLETVNKMRREREQRETYDALAKKYTRPDGTVDAASLSQDPRYIALLENDSGKLKNVEELRTNRLTRETYDALASKYLRPDGTVDTIKLSQDPQYIALLGNDPSKLKTVNELRIAGLDRETSARLASKHLNADGTVNFAKMARDPEYIALFGGDVQKAKTAAELAAAEDKRVQLERLNTSTPLSGAPGTPSTQVQTNAAKQSYLARIDALNNAGLFEEAARLSNQLQALFPDEKFGQSIQFGTINGKRGGFVLGDRGTMKRIDGVQQAPSADTLFNAGKGEIRESEGGLVRINPFTGKATPVIGKDGKQVQGTAGGGKIIETDGGVYQVKGNVAVPVTGPNGQQLPGKVNAGTEDERKAAGFYQRMVEAEKGLQAPIIGKDGKAVVDKNGKVLTLERVAGTPEFMGEAARTILPDWLGAQGLGNLFDSKQRQQYRQYQENWVRANLRAESGAAIGVDEMDKEIRTYFPQINDSKEVIQQKTQARQVTADAMRKRAGRGLTTNTSPQVNTAPTELFPAPPSNNSTLNNLYQQYNLTPPPRKP